jgi:hypothetical protein
VRDNSFAQVAHQFSFAGSHWAGFGFERAESLAQYMEHGATREVMGSFGRWLSGRYWDLLRCCHNRFFRAHTTLRKPYNFAALMSRVMSPRFGGSSLG